MSTSLVDRAANAVERIEARFGRRKFLTRTAVVGSALVAAPVDLLLRPRTAYAALCGCSGRTCDCGSLCCDGYTEFCCAIYGLNACPTGSLAGGWWKVDGSGYCGGGARYYIDCHRRCGTCTCGSGGICSGACARTSCGCGRGRCDHRKAGCTHFRYGNCSNNIRCLGPIVCRVVTCTAPWKIEPTCSSGAVRTDNFTRSHNRPCLQRSSVTPFSGNWDGGGVDGIGVYNNFDASWKLRQSPTSGSASIVLTYGQSTGDIPVVGDWNGDGVDGIGIYRNSTGQWLLRDTATNGNPQRNFVYGQRTGDIPVVGDWNGDGVDGIGVYRNSTGEWLLRDTATPGNPQRRLVFGRSKGDIPVVGDWDGDRRVGIGVFRPSEGKWYLKDSLGDGPPSMIFEFGRVKGDIPVVGDWNGDGRDSVGIYRPAEGTWYLRNTTSSGAPHIEARFGPIWYTG